MVELLRTDSTSPDFITLVHALDAELAERDGSEHSFYAQYNKIHMIRQVVLAYEEGEPVGCGDIKEFEPGTMEVKRMYTAPQHRGIGIAAALLADLEQWTAELDYRTCRKQANANLKPSPFMAKAATASFLTTDSMLV